MARKPAAQAGRQSRASVGATVKKINLALQGGGAHGAFTWGVLDRLLEDPRIAIDGITATSAGAMNAAMVAQGLVEDGADGARAKLAQFWSRVSESGRPARALMGGLPWGGADHRLDLQPGYFMFDLMTRLFSPYQLNPGNFHPLRPVLEELLDLDEIHGCADRVRLFISATNVRTCRIRVFEPHEITVDVLLAAACLPFLFQAVEIDGQHYWDGGYMGNPAIYPLIYSCESRDVVIVHINPIRRDKVPTTAREILDRVNEISFNSSLMREMRVIEFVTRMIADGKIPADQMKQMLVHSIEAEEVMNELGVSSKLNTDWDFLTHLRDVGRERADLWLNQHFDQIGTESSVDLRQAFL